MDNQNQIKDKNLTFVRFTNHRCKIYRNGTEYIGEIMQVRQNFYLHWTFCPAPSTTIGRLAISKKHLLQICEKITKCRSNRFVPSNIQEL